MKKIAAIVACIAISGCASIVEGTDQTITLNIAPDEATCIINDHEGNQIASVTKNSNQAVIPKSRHEIYVICSAPGYVEQTTMVDSSASGWGVAGCFLIDLCITDYSTGALNKYPEHVDVTLVPDVAPAAGPGYE